MPDLNNPTNIAKFFLVVIPIVVYFLFWSPSFTGTMHPLITEYLGLTVNAEESVASLRAKSDGMKRDLAQAKKVVSDLEKVVTEYASVDKSVITALENIVPRGVVDRLLFQEEMTRFLSQIGIDPNTLSIAGDTGEDHYGFGKFQFSFTSKTSFEEISRILRQIETNRRFMIVTSLSVTPPQFDVPNNDGLYTTSYTVITFFRR